METRFFPLRVKQVILVSQVYITIDTHIFYLDIGGGYSHDSKANAFMTS